MSQLAGPAEPASAPAPGPPERVGPIVLAMVAIAVAVAALGAPFGLLWAAMAPDVPVLVTERGPVFAEAQPEQLAAADGWFAILALPFGVLTAAGVWLAARRLARGIPALAALTAGMVGAGLLAWWLGRRVGLTGYRETLAAAEPGTDLARPGDLAVVDVGWWPPHVLGVLLVPALVAVASYTLLAAWSRFPGLRPDTSPGRSDRGLPSAAPAGGRLDLTGAEPDRPART